MSQISTINMSYHNLDILIKNLEIFRDEYILISSLKINHKRAVYKVYDIHEKRTKVLKFIIKTNLTKNQINIFEFFKCDTLKHSNFSPNFCPINKTFEIGLFFVIVMDFIEGDTLYNFFTKSHSKYLYNKVLFELIQALDFLHTNNIIHGDIKPENIIVNQNNVPIFIDFDLSRKLSGIENVTRIFGTKYFMSPEMINKNKISTKTDIWSLGMTLYKCSSSILSDFNTTLNSSNVSKNTLSIISVHYDQLCSIYGKLFITVMISMLSENETLRPSMKDLNNILHRSKWYDAIYA